MSRLLLGLGYSTAQLQKHRMALEADKSAFLHLLHIG